MVAHIKSRNSMHTEIDIDKLTQKYPLFQSTYEYLMKKHNKNELTVAVTLEEIDMSYSDFNAKKRVGKGIPCYRQKSEKSRIYFPVVCVALFLSQDFVKVD